MDPRPRRVHDTAPPTDAPAPPVGDTVPGAHTLAGNPPSSEFLTAPRQQGEIGSLGSYRVLGELGRGGMGAVFRAEDPTLKRQLAIKVMSPQLAADPRAKARFIREAQAQAQVEHPHVTPIYHVGEANGLPFIAMPLLKGQTLAAALRQDARPPVAESVRVGRETAEGLAAAHAEGLVHRDIKPGNVWLEAPKGRVKILDFGLARVEAAADADGDPLTAAGAVVGTPSYMSPEQARGRPVDARTDLFSLGVVLYQMATGQVPFAGPTPLAILFAVTEDEPPAPLTLAPDLPPALDGLIRRLLAKDPAARPQTADAVAEELAAIERSLVVPPVQAIPLSSVPGAPPSPDPWADIGTTDAGEVVHAKSKPAPPTPRVRSRSNSPKWLWPMAGLFGVLAVAAVVLVVRPWKGKPKTEPEVAGQPNPAPPAPGTAPKPKDKDRPADADRAIAAWLLAREKTMVIVRLPEGEEVEVRKPADLPTGPFAVETVEVNTPFTDADLKRLEALARLRDLYLFEGHTLTTDGLRSLLVHKSRLRELCLSTGPITEEGVKVLAQLTELNELDLDGTNVADDWLKQLVALKQLNRLYLSDTGVSDAAVATLGEMKSLTHVYLNNTKVTAAGVKRLAAALPACRIEWGDGQVIEPTKVGSPATAGGLAFDGKSTFVRVPTLAFDGKLPLTIEAWLTPRTLRESHICLLGEPGGGIGISDRGSLGAGFFDGKDWHAVYGQILKPGRRVHVAAVVLTDRITLFVDGRQVGTKAVKFDKLPATKPPALIGKQTPVAPEGHFHGTMHGLRVSRAARYDREFEPPAKLTKEDDTVALYRFDEGAGTRLVDHSGNKHHGVIENGTWIEPGKP